MEFARRGVEPRAVVAAALLALAAVLALTSSGASVSGLVRAASGDAAGRAGHSAPLLFVRNAGQSDPRVRYEARGANASFYFTRRSAVLALANGRHRASLRMRLLGADPTPAIVARQRTAGKVNYFHGADARNWHQGLSTYRELVYRDLWPGVDLAFRGAGGALEYEFRLRPGASVSDVRLAYAGVSRLAIDASGALLLHTPAGVMRDAAPRSYELVGGRRVPVKGRFSVHGKNVGFSVDRHHPGHPLVIDPGLVYSTFLGGSGADVLGGMFVDSAGSVYLAGATDSPDFPTTPGAYDRFRNNREAYVTKLSPDGSQLVYSTFVGGFINDSANGLAVDPSGNAYITGSTDSRNYPTTVGAYDRTFNENTDPSTQSWSDGFVTKLSPDGSQLVYSTFLGGTGHFEQGPGSLYAVDEEGGSGIAVGADGSAFVTGSTGSVDFPTTPGAYDSTLGGSSDIFLTKLDPAGSSLEFSTLLGGAKTEDAGKVQLDGSGNPYLSGFSHSGDFPTTPGAYLPASPYGLAFITKMTTDGSGLVYSTGFWYSDFAVDAQGYVYGTGGVPADSSFPVTPGAYDRSNVNGEAYVAKLNREGSALVYGTFIGGNGSESGSAITVDPAGNVWVAGKTNSADFPTTPGAYDETINPTSDWFTLDGFVAELNAAGSNLVYGTYFGGGPTQSYADTTNAIALDSAGDPYVAGNTQTSGFPTTPGAYDTTYNGSYDVFLFKLHPTASARIAHRLEVSLVPMFRQTISTTQCQARGGAPSTHGPPLSDPSCNPPAYVPGTQAKLGPSAQGLAVIIALPGALETPADEADVSIAVRVTDVRSRATGDDYNPVPDGPDLTLTPVMRVSDNYNGATLTDPATTIDFNFPVALDCAASSDPAVGSTCTIGTSMNSLMPGVIKEGKDMSIGLWRLWLNDSGPNGVRGDGDDKAFAQSGIYVP